MLKAFAGKGDFPKIRTFNKSDISTNSVYKDLEAAEKMYVIFSITQILYCSDCILKKQFSTNLLWEKRYWRWFQKNYQKILKCKIKAYMAYEV